MPRIDEIVTTYSMEGEKIPKRLFTNYRKCPVCKSENLKTSKKCKKCGCKIGEFFTF